MKKIVVTVNLYAGLGKGVDDYNIQKGLNLTVDEGSSVRDILNSLNLSYKNIALVVINGKRNSLSTKISEGDQVDIFPPVGGG